MDSPLSASDDSLEGVAEDAAALPPTVRIFSRHDRGRYALLVLTLINMLNYVDRYVPR